MRTSCRSTVIIVEYLAGYCHPDPAVRATVLSRRGGSFTACKVAMAHPRTIPTHPAPRHAQDSSGC
ncbi:hypothetical protein PLICRDRAFT_42048 [Plicaturopsis crispa FD-325 SS-3]|nr:hypothetical protein PLICRDRAFT_42048 [Plicaturopsis crispa FD-325 SS-3]